MWVKHTKPSWARSDFTPGTWPTNDAIQPLQATFPGEGPPPKIRPGPPAQV